MRSLPAACAALAITGWAGAAEPVAPRLIWGGPGVTLLGGPSRDGKYLSYADPRTGALAIRETATGASRALWSTKVDACRHGRSGTPAGAGRPRI